MENTVYVQNLFIVLTVLLMLFIYLFKPAREKDNCNMPFRNRSIYAKSVTCGHIRYTYNYCKSQYTTSNYWLVRHYPERLLLPCIVCVILLSFSAKEYLLNDKTPLPMMVTNTDLIKNQPSKNNILKTTQAKNSSNYIKPKIVVRLSSEEAKSDFLAKVIWCENRSSLTSMNLVLSVIYNRAKNKTISAMYKEVLKPYQFSCVKKTGEIVRQASSDKDKMMLSYARDLVADVKNNIYEPAIDAIYFYAPGIVNKPKFLANREPALTFEGHEFY